MWIHLLEIYQLANKLLTSSSFLQVSKLFAFLTPPSQEKPIELVECDLETREGLEDVLGNAGVVVCSIGASEKDVLDITGPYRIDYKATKNLIEAGTCDSAPVCCRSLLSVDVRGCIPLFYPWSKCSSLEPGMELGLVSVPSSRDPRIG